METAPLLHKRIESNAFLRVIDSFALSAGAELQLVVGARAFCVRRVTKTNDGNPLRYYSAPAAEMILPPTRGGLIRRRDLTCRPGGACKMSMEELLADLHAALKDRGELDDVWEVCLRQQREHNRAPSMVLARLLATDPVSTDPNAAPEGDMGTPMASVRPEESILAAPATQPGQSTPAAQPLVAESPRAISAIRLRCVSCDARLLLHHDELLVHVVKRDDWVVYKCPSDCGTRVMKVSEVYARGESLPIAVASPGSLRD